VPFNFFSATLRKPNYPHLHLTLSQLCMHFMKRVYINISTIIAVTSESNTRKNWLLVVDEATNFKWSHFFTQKNDLSQQMITHLGVLKGLDCPVGFVRLDNAGKNKSFRDQALTNGYGDVVFEFTASGGPMQNGDVEQAFPTLLGSVQEVMNNAVHMQAMRDRMWQKQRARAQS
jgi:hypothetical protein